MTGYRSPHLARHDRRRSRTGHTQARPGRRGARSRRVLERHAFPTGETAEADEIVRVTGSTGLTLEVELIDQREGQQQWPS